MASSPGSLQSEMQRELCEWYARGCARFIARHLQPALDVADFETPIAQKDLLAVPRA